jgi:hypothetical protein
MTVSYFEEECELQLECYGNYYDLRGKMHKGGNQYELDISSYGETKNYGT